MMMKQGVWRVESMKFLRTYSRLMKKEVLSIAAKKLHKLK